MSTSTELTVELPQNVSRAEAQLALAVRLFQQGKVSLGQAAGIARVSQIVVSDSTCHRENNPHAKDRAARKPALCHLNCTSHTFERRDVVPSAAVTSRMVTKLPVFLYA